MDHTAREQLRLDLPPTLTDLDDNVADYLDHHGDLAQLLDAVKDEEADDRTPAAWAREILHRHLFVITLLLEKIEAHELAHADLVLGRRSGPATAE